MIEYSESPHLVHLVIKVLPEDDGDVRSGVYPLIRIHSPLLEAKSALPLPCSAV